MKLIHENQEVAISRLPALDFTTLGKYEFWLPYFKMNRDELAIYDIDSRLQNLQLASQLVG
ncbi:MAG: hypothetical protein HC845_07420 [Akkermansiaceae bacterium]|nr:hypothetical protein [Akkermansiaceae bacterium]